MVSIVNSSLLCTGYAAWGCAAVRSFARRVSSSCCGYPSLFSISGAVARIRCAQSSGTSSSGEVAQSQLSFAGTKASRGPNSKFDSNASLYSLCEARTVFRPGARSKAAAARLRTAAALSRLLPAAPGGSIRAQYAHTLLYYNPRLWSIL